MNDETIRDILRQVRAGEESESIYLNPEVGADTAKSDAVDLSALPESEHQVIENPIYGSPETKAGN